MGIITEIIWPNFRRNRLCDTDISVGINFGPGVVSVMKPLSIKFLASTVDKMQRCTVDSAIIYLVSKLFAAGQFYLAPKKVT